ncbi:hypothetical protein GM3708_1930 [Geminocystis sp. NIES-3708]|uniref:hypothetical protein n=1 Tax=Geminocystis sp. NIES-3708 TaxID=1615909 RepID=UPI0005FCB0E9|nr:hypothetical protein [Geminocystis sp. NIES-3708]BAQ61524.1 hypothetical protein GM3708_1930 [Geminocystis sp. NIES-3708]
MKKSRSENSSQFFEHIQLSLPLFTSQKPFLDMKKQVRGKNRKLFDTLEKVINDFQVSLHRDEFQSTEVRFAVRQLLSFTNGNKS